MTTFLAEHVVAELGLLAWAMYVTAVVMAVDAVMRNRTAQGAIAWAVSLITIVVNDPGFAGEVEAMFRDDLAGCRQIHPGALTERRLWFRLAVRISRLLAPIQ